MLRLRARWVACARVVALLGRLYAIFFCSPATRNHDRVSGTTPPRARRQARSLLMEAQAKKKISKAEAKEIENDLRCLLYTSDAADE